MRWIIHIGSPKTGSTAIQRFLFTHREALLAQGVHYPDVCLRGYGHHDLAFRLYGSYPVWATSQEKSLEELSAAFIAACRAQPAEQVVVSSENFYLYPTPEALSALLDAAGRQPDDTVQIVCYVRRQDETVVSWYNQTVKAQGNYQSFAQTHARDRHLWDYAHHLTRWRNVFGEQSVVARHYLADTGSFDARRDFLTLLGLSPSAFALAPSRTNERINRDILEFQRVINRFPLPTRYKRHFHKKLIALTAAEASSGLFDDTPYLSPRERAELMQFYAAGNAALARSCLNDALAFDTPDEPHATPSGTARRGLTLRKVSRILRWITIDR